MSRCHKRRLGARAIRAGRRASAGSKARRLPLCKTTEPLSLRVRKIQSPKHGVEDPQRERNDMVASSLLRAQATRARQAPRLTRWAADRWKSGGRRDATRAGASAPYKTLR